MSVAQHDREFASVGRRLGAACIDVTGVLVAMAGGMGGRLLWGKRRPGDVFKDLEDLLERWSTFTETPRWRRAGPVLSVVGTVGLRNWRSPGLRMMGIHREDVRTGGPVTMRNVLTRDLAGRARGRLVKRLTMPKFERQHAQVQAIQGSVEAARREHPDDRVAQQRAIMQVYRDAGVDPASCCWWPLAALIFDVLVLLATPGISP